MSLISIRYIGLVEPFFETALTGRPQSWRRGQTAELESTLAATLIGSGVFEHAGDVALGADALRAPGGRARLPVGSMLVAPLTGIPVSMTSERVSLVLGPTAQANAVSEYNTLISGKREIRFDTTAQFNLNKASLYTQGVACAFPVYELATKLAAAPWPKTGDDDWWEGRGAGVGFTLVGDEVTITYATNAPNKAKVFVNGKAMPGANAAGAVENGVASSANARQWFTLTLPERGEWDIVAELGSIKSIVIKRGDQIRPLKFRGRALVLGDSFAGRFVATGEVEHTRRAMAAGALEALGYDVVDCSTGGTGVFADGGGRAAGKLNFSGTIDYLLSVGGPLGFNGASFDVVWVFCSGNDSGSASQAGYLALIEKAKAAFPNAAVVVSTVYEGYNTPAVAKALNDMIVGAVSAAGPRVVLMPIDAAYHPEKLSLFFGTGSVAAPAGDGNADVYLSNVAQGAGDRHPNREGVKYGSAFLANELVRVGVAYDEPKARIAKQGATIPVSQSRSLSASDAGCTLDVTSGGVTLTVPAGLNLSPGVVVQKHSSGTSIGFSGGANGNGASTTLAIAAQMAAIVPTSVADAYRISGV
jgi:hypothetical protein